MEPADAAGTRRAARHVEKYRVPPRVQSRGAGNLHRGAPGATRAGGADPLAAAPMAPRPDARSATPAATAPNADEKCLIMGHHPFLRPQAQDQPPDPA
jgi:hypothetical protein